MWKTITSWFRARTTTRQSTGHLDQRREVQALRLELEESRSQIITLHEEIERLQLTAARNENVAVDRTLERLVEGLAPPLSQLATQSHLVDSGTDLRARDVLAVATSLLAELRAHGVSIDPEVGGEAAFDADLHRPLMADRAIRHGEPVIVRTPGVRLHDTMILRAGVDSASSGS